jgi:hypothetical protein
MISDERFIFACGGEGEKRREKTIYMKFTVSLVIISLY